ncbi:unnamed protein product, partial [Ectocarpus sp. 13 AM-2016]
QNGGGGDNGRCRESCSESDVTITIVGDAVDLVRLVPFGGQTRDTSEWELGGKWTIFVSFCVGFHAVVLTSVSNHRGKVWRFLLPMEVDTVFGSGASLFKHCQRQLLLCNELTGLLLTADV